MNKLSWNTRRRFANLVVIFILGLILIQPLTRLCFDSLDEDIELLENLGDEDPEEEKDDLEETDKFFDDHLMARKENKCFSNISIFHYFQLENQFKKGVKSPPPEFTMFSLI